VSTNVYADGVEPRWLDEREERAWRGFLRLRSDLFGHLGRQLARDSGLTAAEFAVLVAVSEAPGHRIRSRDLCRSLDWERSRLSHQIARMEQRGTVTRAPCPQDGRGFDVVLTAAGLAAIEAAAPLHLEVVRHCFIDVLTTDQLEALGAIADAVSAHLADEHGDCPPPPC